MEILSCSFLVCRAWSAQWRSVGAVAPERVVASFLCSRLVSCTCALLCMLPHSSRFIQKQSYPLHHLQHLERDVHFGEVDIPEFPAQRKNDQFVLIASESSTISYSASEETEEFSEVT